MRPCRHECNDVICLAVPEGVDLNDPASFIPQIERLAWRSVRQQWPPRARITLEEGRIEWLITSDLAKVDEFQPAHDCEQCRSGNAQAREFLRQNPGATIAMGNIHYVEVRQDYDLPPGLSEKDQYFITKLLDGDDQMSISRAIELLAQLVQAPGLAQLVQAPRNGPRWTEI